MGVGEGFRLEALQARAGQSILFERLLVRVHEEAAADCIDDSERPVLQLQNLRPGAANQGDTQAAGQDRGVGRRRAGGQGNADDMRLIEMGCIERRQVFGKQDRAGGQSVQLASRRNSSQTGDEALTDIADIGGATGEVLVAEAAEELHQFAGRQLGGAGGVRTGIDGGAHRVGQRTVMKDFAMNEEDFGGRGLPNLPQAGQFLIHKQPGCQKALPLFCGRPKVRGVGGIPLSDLGGRGITVNIADPDTGCC